jgi:hypothetical protein
MPGKPPAPWFPLDYTNPLTQGLIVLWPLSEGLGSTTAYNACAGPPGSLVAPTTWVNSSHFNLSAAAPVIQNGINGMVKGTIPRPIGFPITLSCWAMRTTPQLPGDTLDYVMLSVNSTSVASDGMWLALIYNPSTMALFSCMRSQVASLTTGKTDPWTLDANWHHYAAVFASPSSFALARDGVLNAATAPSTVQTPSQCDGVALGYRNLNVGIVQKSFTGYLDMPAVWNRALSSSEIASYYADPWQVFRSPFVKARRLGSARAGSRR